MTPAVRQTSRADEWRTHFPALSQMIDGKPLVYLDSAATTLRPDSVIEAITNFYRTDNANPGASLHTLARRSHEHYEGARRTVAEFIGASDPAEVVFVRGTTEAINLVAASWGGVTLHSGDEILLCVAEHASNLVPWQLVAKRTGAHLTFFDIDDRGRMRVDDFAARLSRRTKLVALSHVSNVLGVINPVAELSALAHRAGAVVLVDAAQSVPHFPVDVNELGCDFLAFSSHKMLGPMGVGVLWARGELLAHMPPYQGGSNMAHDIGVDSMHLSDGALRFGAGTPNVSGPVGLAAAIAFLRSIGFEKLRAHERSIVEHVRERVAANRRLRLLGQVPPDEKISVFSFTVDGVAPLDVLRMLDAQGIAVRAGDLASLPLLERLGTKAAVRASCYLYTTHEEVDILSSALEQLGSGSVPASLTMGVPASR